MALVVAGACVVVAFDANFVVVCFVVVCFVVEVVAVTFEVVGFVGAFFVALEATLTGPPRTEAATRSKQKRVMVVLMLRCCEC